MFNSFPENQGATTGNVGDWLANDTNFQDFPLPDQPGIQSWPMQATHNPSNTFSNNAFTTSSYDAPLRSSAYLPLVYRPSPAPLTPAHPLKHPPISPEITTQQTQTRYAPFIRLSNPPVSTSSLTSDTTLSFRNLIQMRAMHRNTLGFWNALRGNGRVCMARVCGAEVRWEDARSRLDEDGEMGKGEDQEGEGHGKWDGCKGR